MEETLLQHHDRLLRVTVDRFPKYHPEVSGEELEYDWECFKLFNRHLNMREKKDKRMLHINESFQNIKGIKLYGWEQKFIDKIESIYKEETALKHHS